MWESILSIVDPGPYAWTILTCFTFSELQSLLCVRNRRRLLREDGTIFSICTVPLLMGETC